MGQFFEVFKGDSKALKDRMLALKAATATAISFQLTEGAATYIISYTAAALVTPAQPSLN